MSLKQRRPIARKLFRMPGRAKCPQSICLNAALLGRKRINSTLKEYAQQHPELTSEEFQLLKQKFGHLFAAPSVAAYSQRLRRLSETYADDPILSKRLAILNGLAVPLHELSELHPSFSIFSAARPFHALSG